MDPEIEKKAPPSELHFMRPTDDTLLVSFAGNWKIGSDLPSAEEVLRQVESGPEIQRVTFDAWSLTGWDSGFLTFLTKILNHCSQKGIGVVTIISGNTMFHGIYRFIIGINRSV